MFSETDIIAQAWMLRELVNELLVKEGLYVDKILLCGSYASGRATEDSDLDFIVQLKPKMYPRDLWNTMDDIQAKINDPRIHIIFGTEEAAKSLHEKHLSDIKTYAYKNVQLPEITAKEA